MKFHKNVNLKIHKDQKYIVGKVGEPTLTLFANFESTIYFLCLFEFYPM